MRDVTRLRADARLAYERGRAAAALRVAVVVIPLAALCARETDAPWRCAAAGAGVLLVAAFARWRQVHGRRTVDAGLLTGVIPMSAAVLLCRFAGAWPASAALGICAAAGFVSGGIAGRVTMGWARAESADWVTAAVVAGLTGAMGCVGIGVGTAVGAVAGVVLGAVVAAQTPRHAPL